MVKNDNLARLFKNHKMQVFGKKEAITTFLHTFVNFEQVNSFKYCLTDFNFSRKIKFAV